MLDAVTTSKEERREQWGAVWSAERHHTFPPAARRRAASLLVLGAHLANRRYAGESRALLDVWCECTAARNGDVGRLVGVVRADRAVRLGCVSAVWRRGSSNWWCRARSAQPAGGGGGASFGCCARSGYVERPPASITVVTVHEAWFRIGRIVCFCLCKFSVIRVHI